MLVIFSEAPQEDTTVYYQARPRFILHRWRELWPQKDAETGSTLRGTNSGKTGAGVCFRRCGVDYSVRDRVLCAANIQAQMHVGPSHVFSNEKACKRAVSNAWCKGVVCMTAELFVGLQKVFSSLFTLSFSWVFLLWGLLFSSRTSDPSMCDRKYACKVFTP